MNKTQLIDLIAEKADLSKAQAKAALESTLDGITDALKEGDQVQLIGCRNIPYADAVRKSSFDFLRFHIRPNGRGPQKWP